MLHVLVSVRVPGVQVLVQPARTAVKFVIKLYMESRNLFDSVGLVLQDSISCA
jgi:hypothetical protein